MKITKGRRETATRVVIYGVEKIGKSTLAASFPSALVIDTEDGTNHLEVDRVTVGSYLDAEGAIHELSRDARGYQTVVIDSGDWLERLMIEHLLSKSQKRSIEDFGFGKGYTMVAEAMGRFLAACDTLVERGINVVIVCHATVKRCSPPDMDEGYDRFELKLTKQAGPIVKEWADCILFANYKTRLVEGEDGRTRARGGKERVLHTERSAAWDAGNRYGLAPELPMTIEALAPLFAAPAKPKGWRDRVAEATNLAELTEISRQSEEARGAGKLSDDQLSVLRAFIDSRMDEVSAPQEAEA
jgi:hypothetical protein